MSTIEATCNLVNKNQQRSSVQFTTKPKAGSAPVIVAIQFDNPEDADGYQPGTVYTISINKKSK